MPKLLKTILSISAFLILSATILSAEQLTITTYYPSPYGVYRELRSQRMAIGENYIQHDTVCWEGEANCEASIYQTVIPTASNTDLIVEGNVGIGTMVPGAKLVIRDTTNSIGTSVLRIAAGEGDTVNTGGAIEYYTGWEASPMGRIYTKNIYSAGVGNSKGKLVLSSYVNEYKDEMTLFNGNVGIGTTNPQWASVQIESNAVPLAFRETDQSGAGSLWRMPLDAKSLRFDVSDDGITFGPLYTTPFRLHMNGSISVGSGFTNGSWTPPANGAIIQGNVGIGTVAPESKLEVNGEMHLGPKKLVTIHRNLEIVGPNNGTAIGLVNAQTGKKMSMVWDSRVSPPAPNKLLFFMILMSILVGEQPFLLLILRTV